MNGHSAYQVRCTPLHAVKIYGIYVYIFTYDVIFLVMYIMMFI